jgi:hypothetical protein
LRSLAFDFMSVLRVQNTDFTSAKQATRKALLKGFMRSLHVHRKDLEKAQVT